MCRLARFRFDPEQERLRAGQIQCHNNSQDVVESVIALERGVE